jgi:hypothetical protein
MQLGVTNQDCSIHSTNWENELLLGMGALPMKASCQQQDRLKVVSDCLYVRDAMYSSYTSILLVVVTQCCLHSRYQQAEIGRAGTSRHQLLTQAFEAALAVIVSPNPCTQHGRTHVHCRLRWATVCGGPSAPTPGRMPKLHPNTPSLPTATQLASDITFSITQRVSSVKKFWISPSKSP